MAENSLDNNLVTIVIVRGPGCEDCSFTGEVLYFYPRGPNDPPGNTMIPCPSCYGGEEKEEE
jgi:hypothetical protein